MRSLLEVATSHDVGELVTAIYEHCVDIHAKRSFHDLAKPYFDTLLRHYSDKFSFDLIFGIMEMPDGTHEKAYLLTLYRSDGLVSKWALYTNEEGGILLVAEQDPDLPDNPVVRH